MLRASFPKTSNTMESLRELPASPFPVCWYGICIPKAGETKWKMQRKVFSDRLLHWLLHAMMNSVILATNAKLNMTMLPNPPSRASLLDARISGRRHHCAGWRKWRPAHSRSLEAWRRGFFPIQQWVAREILHMILFYTWFLAIWWPSDIWLSEACCASWHGSGGGDMIAADGSDARIRWCWRFWKKKSGWHWSMFSNLGWKMRWAEELSESGKRAHLDLGRVCHEHAQYIQVEKFWPK